MYRVTPTTKANARKRRNGIAKAARQQVAHGGFRSATVKAETQRANCSTGLLYQYFANAEQLLTGTFGQVSEFELGIFSSGLNAHHDIGSAMQAGVEIFIGRSLAGPRLADALLFETLPLRVEEERLLFRRKWAAAIATRLEQAIADGQLPAQHTGIVSTAITGALAENLLPWLHDSTSHEPAMPVAEFIVQLQGLCRKMIGLALVPDLHRGAAG